MLQTLVDPDIPNTLTGAAAIDEAGRITGRAKLATGATLPFIATPVD